VQLQPVRIHGRQHAGKAGQGAGDVGQAAGHVEPRRAQAREGPGRGCVGIGRRARVPTVQGVGVEPGVAGVGDRSGDDVVQGPLDVVGVGRLRSGEQQPPAEHRRSDGRAGLRVGAVGRQLPVVAEPLVLVARTLPTRDVGAPGDRPVPLAPQRIEQCGVPELDGDVRRPGRQVVRPYRVATQHLGVPDRHVVLVVGPPPLLVGQGAVPPAVDEQPRLVEVAGVAGQPAEFGQSDLDLGVAAHRLDPALAEHLADQVRRAHRHPEQAVVGVRVGAAPGDRSLEEVPQAVQLVAPGQVRPARHLAGPPEVGVEVAVRLLGGRDPGDEVAERRLQFLVRAGAQLPGRRFEELVDLGVGELPATTSLRQRACRGEVEVPDPAFPRLPVRDVAQRDRGVRPLPFGPEAAGDPDLAEAERTQPARAGYDGRGRDVGGEHDQPFSAPDMKPRT